MAAALHRGEHSVEDAEIGIAGTGVVEAGGIAVGKGGGWKDRRHHGAGVPSEAVAVMDHPGVQTFVAAFLQCH